jgi:hypothetical protein
MYFRELNPGDAKTHVNLRHQDMVRDITALAWFWRTVHTLIEHQPWTTGIDALSERPFLECGMER